MEIKEFQNLMNRIYFNRDNRRGINQSFLWLIEEIGELAKEVRKEDVTAYQKEFADCFAWLTSLANLLGVNLEDALKIYEKGCPKCGKMLIQRTGYMVGEVHLKAGKCDYCGKPIPGIWP